MGVPPTTWSRNYNAGWKENVWNSIEFKTLQNVTLLATSMLFMNASYSENYMLIDNNNNECGENWANTSLVNIIP